jgi:hypothetical protein
VESPIFLFGEAVYPFAPLAGVPPFMFSKMDGGGGKKWDPYLSFYYPYVGFYPPELFWVGNFSIAWGFFLWRSLGCHGVHPFSFGYIGGIPYFFGAFWPGFSGPTLLGAGFFFFVGVPGIYVG